jgi:solute carrier family 44 (choline transporter-like protein), member 2/4/5
MVTEGRGCTDVVCLLIFGLFWGGMCFVGYEALTKGEPSRIMYGLDSYGNYCGMLNVKDNGTRIIDLRNAKKLHYLNPLELLDPTNYQYAQSVCVEQCPTAAHQCNMTDLPCALSSQYVCPYYSYSRFSVDGGDELQINATKGPASTDWWDDLDNYSGTSCVDADFLTAIPSYIASAMNTTSSCGSYYKTSSMYPGEGPCSAIFFETTEFMNRCFPVIPKEAHSTIGALGSSGLASSFTSVSSEQIQAVRHPCLH